MNKLHFTLLSIFTIITINCENYVDPNIVATVGESIITSDDLTKAYSLKLINTKAQDSEFERKRTLDKLIQTKLFAEAAKSKNLSIDSLGANRVKLAKELALRDELYNQKISAEDQIINEGITRKHFKWKNTEVLLKHLYHPTKSALDTIVPILKKDQDQFDIFAKKIFKDEKLKESGGNLGWISYNVLDPHLENVAFSMPINEVNGPVRSSYGWHILLKIDERKQVILSEEDYQNTKKSLNNEISKKYSQIKANDYINDLMDNDIVIDDALVMNTLRKIHSIIFKKNNEKNNLNSQNTNEIKEFMVDLKVNSDSELARYQKGSFTIDDLLNNLRNSSPKSFLENPIQAFYISLRNHILTNEAIHHGLLKNKNVQRRIKSKEDEYMAREFLLSLSKIDGKTNFSNKEIKTITEKLKTQFPITIYHENIDRIFQAP